MPIKHCLGLRIAFNSLLVVLINTLLTVKVLADDLKIPAYIPLGSSLPPEYEERNILIDKKYLISRADFLQFYLEISTKTEWEDQNHIVKFTGDVPYWIFIGNTLDVPFAFRESQKILSEISEITGLRIFVAPPGSMPKLFIDFTVRKNLSHICKDDPLAERSGCVVVLGEKNTKEIGRVDVGVSVDIDVTFPVVDLTEAQRQIIAKKVTKKLITHTLIHEIVQAFGQVNDTTELPFSVFNDTGTRPRLKNVVTELSEIDKMALCLHYSPDLKTGFNRDQIVKTVINGKLIDKCAKKFASTL